MAHTLEEAVVTEMLRIVSHPLEKIKADPDLKLEFAQIHKRYTGSKLCCDEAIDQSYYWMQTVISQYQKKKMKQQHNSNYKLKEDMILYFPELHAQISNVNLTDDIAVLMLQHNPGWAKHFDQIPAGGIPEPLTAKQKNPGTDKAAIAAAHKNAEEIQGLVDSTAEQNKIDGEKAAADAAADAEKSSSASAKKSVMKKSASKKK